MAANFNVTQFVTWAKPLYGVLSMACFSFPSANTRSIFSFRSLYRSAYSGVYRASPRQLLPVFPDVPLYRLYVIPRVGTQCPCGTVSFIRELPLVFPFHKQPAVRIRHAPCHRLEARFLPPRQLLLCGVVSGLLSSRGRLVVLVKELLATGFPICVYFLHQLADIELGCCRNLLLDPLALMWVPSINTALGERSPAPAASSKIHVKR